ncbi:sensor histidine kinase [Kitasatospora paracochleata]|uniref:histidine kinase n=1 Tax=Kitasatospora paracochleata TaxID=58354 RepID=A0ABT1J0G4_9ACTN|nr:sensor histidine kinase [Kitasatospora paracochleata]MCP2310649.1 signal transduction histidine kinase [Kitasatospora paracochleata]
MDQQLQPPLTRRLTRDHLIAIDALVAVVVGTVTAMSTVLTHPRTQAPIWLAAALVGCLAGGIALRRTYPFTALILATTAAPMMVYLRFLGFAPMAVALVLYTVALEKAGRTAVIALAATLLASLASTGVVQQQLGHPFFDPLRLSEPLLIPLAGWMAGWATAHGRAYNRGLQAQAEARAEMQLAQARRTIVEERMRIARELHDVVAHGMSIIAVQAGVGNHVSATQPAEAAKALAAIETTSRSTLWELRSLLGVLRDGAPAELLPGGLADLSTLIAQTKQAAVDVELTVEGTPRELPHGIDLAAYRIVQEALTNVVRHARTDRALVQIDYAQDTLGITVTDEGIGCADTTSSTGHGLVGMRERAALYGGDITIGGRTPGGFRVAVRLPTRPDTRAASERWTRPAAEATRVKQ